MFLFTTTALAGTLALTGDAWFADDDLVLVRDGHEVAMPSGYLFGVEADGQPAGVVFIGRGHTDTELSRREAEQLGNQLVLGGEASLERMREVVDLGRMREAIDTALILGLDAPAITASLRRVAVDGGVEGYYDQDGVFQVVVVDRRLGASRRQAAERLHDRQEVLSELGLDPHDALRMDRHEDRDRWVVDVRGDTRFHPTVPDAIAAPRSRWTTWVEDPTGAVDDAHSAVWLAHGLIPGDHGDHGSVRRIAGVAGVPTGARLDRVVANVVVEPEHTGLFVDLSVESLVTYRSVGESRLVRLHVPCHEQEVLYEQIHVTPSCGLDQATLDGLPLTYIGRGFGRTNHVDEGGVYLLPEPLQPETPRTLRVKHHDRLAFGPLVLGPEEMSRRTKLQERLGDVQGGLPYQVRLGPTTEAADVLPYGTRPSDPVQVELRAASTHKRYQVAVSGQQERTLQRGAVSWEVVVEPGRPRLVVGDFDERSEGAAAGMPAVRVLTWDPMLNADLEVLARATIHFFSDALTDFPYDELEIVQGSDRIAWELGPKALPRPEVVSAPGQLHIKGIQAYGDAGRMLRSRWPHVFEVEVVEGVAAQWWQPVERPYLADDAWIGTAMPRLYAELFLDHAYKAKVLRMWRDRPRDALGDDALVEREAQRVAELFHGMVRERVGEREMLRGLDAFLTSGGRTTEELQHALERVTGADLNDVFTVWLDGRFRPELTASWTLRGDEVHVDLHTDLPFGTVQVPVRVETGRRIVTRWVPVTDGHGEVRIALDGALGQVAVDPDGLLPLRAIHVDEGGGPGFAFVGP